MTFQLTDPEIKKVVHASVDLPLDEAYRQLCKAQLRKVVDEFAKKPDWEALAREMK